MVYLGQARSPLIWGVMQRKTKMTGMPRDHIKLRAVLIKHWSHENQWESWFKCRLQGPAHQRSWFIQLKYFISQCNLDRRSLPITLRQTDYRLICPDHLGLHCQLEVRGITKSMPRRHRSLCKVCQNAIKKIVHGMLWPGTETGTQEKQREECDMG